MLDRTTRRRGDAKGTATSGAVRGAVGTQAVPSAVLDLSALSRVDYVDHVAIAHPHAAEVTAEHWARAMFGDAPDPTVRLLWGGVLGLRLALGVSRDTVAGWRIAERGEGWIRLTTSSRSATAELIVHADDAQLGLALVVRFDRRTARINWLPIAAVHRRLVPVLLRSTVRKVAA